MSGALNHLAPIEGHCRSPRYQPRGSPIGRIVAHGEVIDGRIKVPFQTHHGELGSIGRDARPTAGVTGGGALGQRHTQAGRLSHETARFLGVADCEWSCFLDGCYVGREGRMVNILEGCNGLRLAIVYAAYVIGIGGWTWRSLLQAFIGLFVVQLFNVVRIGSLVALRDHGGDTYFFFIKYVFGLFIYGSIVVLWMLKPRIDRWMGAR